MTTGNRIEILLVDDDPVDVELTTRQLEQSKVRNRIRSVANGSEALSYLRRDPPHEAAARPDVVLLDLNMPVMDGHEFLRQMKADPSLRSIPVVVLTTSDEDEDIARSYELHANAFVTKPVGLEQLARVVEAIEEFWFEIVRFPPG